MNAPRFSPKFLFEEFFHAHYHAHAEWYISIATIHFSAMMHGPFWHLSLLLRLEDITIFVPLIDGQEFPHDFIFQSRLPLKLSNGYRYCFLSEFYFSIVWYHLTMALLASYFRIILSVNYIFEWNIWCWCGYMAYHICASPPPPLLPQAFTFATSHLSPTDIRALLSSYWRLVTYCFSRRVYRSQKHVFRAITKNAAMNRAIT